MTNALLGRLPPKARRKLAAISDGAQEAQDLIFNIGRRLSDAHSAMRNAGVSGDAGIQEEIDKLMATQSRHSVRLQALAQVCAQSQHFLQGLMPSAVLEDAPSVKLPALKKNETHLQAVERIRAEIVSAQADHATFANAAVPAATHRHQ